MRTLADAPVGFSVRVSEIRASDTFVERLQDMGLTRGVPVICLFAAPRGNPRAYVVRGGIVAMRNKDAAKIIIK